MINESFNYVVDSDGALRMMNVPEHQKIGPSSLVFRTTDAADFDAKISDNAYKAGVLVLPKEEIEELTNNFNTLLEGMGKVTITAKAQPDGTFAYSFEKDQHQEILEHPVMDALNHMADTYHRNIPQLTHLEIELGRNLTLGLHPHPYPVANRILGDSATGWVTTDLGPDNAGEGNLLLFKGTLSTPGGFYHEATSRSLTTLDSEKTISTPNERTSIIVRPNTAHWGEFVRQITPPLQPTEKTATGELRV